MGRHVMSQTGEGSTRLCLSGTFGPEDALDLKEAFLLLLDQSGNLELSLAGVEGLGVTFLQLLFALIQGAKTKGLELRLTDELSPHPLKQALTLGVSTHDLNPPGLSSR